MKINIVKYSLLGIICHHGRLKKEANQSLPDSGK